MLFDEECKMVGRCDVAHRQYYPQEGYVEHDAEEIYQNTVAAIRQVRAGMAAADYSLFTINFTLCITNQRETVVVWNKHTGKPISERRRW